MLYQIIQDNNKPLYWVTQFIFISLSNDVLYEHVTWPRICGLISMAQLVASTSGVVLGGVVMVVGSNLARGKIFTASIGSVDILYPSVFIYDSNPTLMMTIIKMVNVDPAAEKDVNAAK